jgi:hypothetical protein
LALAGRKAGQPVAAAGRRNGEKAGPVRPGPSAFLDVLPGLPGRKGPDRVRRFCGLVRDPAGFTRMGKAGSSLCKVNGKIRRGKRRTEGGCGQAAPSLGKALRNGIIAVKGVRKVGSTLREGLRSGFKTTWILGKVIFPVTLIVTLLQSTPVLPWLMDLLSPVMGLFGLPGEAAIPLVLGNVLNLYAGIGAILSLPLSVKEVFILAVMLSFSHNLFIESGVAAKSGVKLWLIVLVRFGLAVGSAAAIHLLWQGGEEEARYGLVAGAGNAEGSVLWEGIKRGFFGVVQTAVIVIPLMVAIQIMKDKRWLDVFSKKMAPVTRFLGLGENTALALTAGLIFGMAYGAGVLLRSIREEGVSRRDASVVFIFLAACHAVIEDTLVFAPLGIPVLPLFLLRLSAAVLLTVAVSQCWKDVSQTGRKDWSHDYRSPL